MGKASRAAWANHPAIKAALRDEVVAPKEKEVSTRVAAMRRAIDVNKQSLDDSATFISDQYPRFEMHFPNAKLLSNNVVKRMHDVQLTPYKDGWKKRIADLVYASLPVVREWRANIRYPLICEVLYLSSSKNLMDDDGLHGAFKVVLDGIVKAALIEDDQKRHVVHILNWTEYSATAPGLYVSLFTAPTRTGYISERTLSLLAKM